MRKIVAFLFVSVDGVVGEPADWLAMSEDVEAMITARSASADTILLGRATYEEFAAEWPHRSGPIADFVNATRKVVVSTSLYEVSWQNTALIDGNALIGEELARLRHTEGKDIVVLGSATLVQSLLRRAMIDELVLLIQPVIKGRGRRLFDELKEHAPMEKVECATFDSGLVSLSYEMTSRQHAFDGVSTEFEPDSFTAIIGPSGSGKSIAAALRADYEFGARQTSLDATDAALPIYLPVGRRRRGSRLPLRSG